jgi:hypothetical protein
MELEANIRLVQVAVEMVDPSGIEGRGAPLDAVDDVALLEQEIGEVGAVLSGHARDHSDVILIRIIQEVWPTEIYNLAAQSHVQVSFEAAEYTANADAIGSHLAIPRLFGSDRRPPCETSHVNSSGPSVGPPLRRAARNHYHFIASHDSFQIIQSPHKPAYRLRCKGYFSVAWIFHEPRHVKTLKHPLSKTFSPVEILIHCRITYHRMPR